MAYEVKPKQEGAWGATQIVVAYVLMQFDIPAEVAVAGGVLARPVLGYAMRFLPKPKADA